MAQRRFQSPKGTRDFYPEEMLRRRYVTEAWRAVSLRHGFEEIDGPTFEHLELYTVKSGEEIVSQLFSFTRAGGDDAYALRPEFTPTLARMYAARAAQLPKPVRWFSVLPYFRAEKPQRGRLREFLQWNCDVIGGDSGALLNTKTADTVDVCLAASSSLGLCGPDARLKFGFRSFISDSLQRHGIHPSKLDEILTLLDMREKLSDEEYVQKAKSAGLPDAFITENHPIRRLIVPLDVSASSLAAGEGMTEQDAKSILDNLFQQDSLPTALADRGLAGWCEYDSMIIRGLAYYTGAVFELSAEGERAVAGGGRYDNLIELLGGPPTPAVGFAMGDVVLSNLLADKGLMPEPAELPGAVEAMLRAQRVRPEVFVVSGGEEDDQHVVPLVARLRRGIERDHWQADARPWHTDRRYAIRPLHARTTDKSTRNLKKLLGDAEKQGARFAAVIHGPDKVQLKDLDAREDLPDNFSIDPDSETYVGRAVTHRLNGA